MADLTTIPETGWVFYYEWSLRDYGTWLAFLVAQLYFSVLLFVRSLEHRKATLFWFIIYAGIFSNFAAGVSGVAYIDCKTFNSDPEATCDVPRRFYYAFVILYYQMSFTLVYYRKLKLVPDLIAKRGVLDATVLLACSVLSLVGNVPSFYLSELECFAYDIYCGIAAILSFLYFEVWFASRVAQMTMESSQKLLIFQLTVRTGLMKLVYLVGSFSFKIWGGNFFTNTFWNMGYCLVSLAVIETLMSAQFLKLFKTQTTLPKAESFRQNDSQSRKSLPRHQSTAGTTSSLMPPGQTFESRRPKEKLELIKRI